MNAFHLVLTLLVHSVRALGRSRADLVLENVALRQQIAVLTRTRCVPRWQAEERLLWVALRRTWRRWQDALVIVQPETVVAWHRKASGATGPRSRAASLNDLRSPPGNHLEMLRGDWKGFHSIRINNQWRIVFRWSDAQAHDVRIIDYHRG